MKNRKGPSVAELQPKVGVFPQRRKGRTGRFWRPFTSAQDMLGARDLAAKDAK